jgi:predicted O-methyltransferase YrrM
MEAQPEGFSRGPVQVFLLRGPKPSRSRSALRYFADEDYRLARLARGAELSAVYESIVSAGRTPLVIDCGANIGLSAKYFSLEFPNARIIAIEPEKENMAQARRNCPSENVHFRLAAVASHTTRGSLRAA